MWYYMLLNRDVLSVSNFRAEKSFVVLRSRVFSLALWKMMELDVKTYVVMRDYKDSVNVPKIHTRHTPCSNKIIVSATSTMLLRFLEVNRQDTHILWNGKLLYAVIKHTFSPRNFHLIPLNIGHPSFESVPFNFNK